jgi:hypothetical protein
VVLSDERLQRALVELNHDLTTAAHLGATKTCYALMKQYWWPGCRKFVQQYVKGCAICQANKPITRKNNPPINRIIAEEGAAPFKTIAIDFIVKLPVSKGYDSLMTITNHDCTKALAMRLLTQKGLQNCSKIEYSPLQDFQRKSSQTGTRDLPQCSSRKYVHSWKSNRI